ncbi:hypothetical protein AAJ72_02855 [Citromicrobium sp. RCC1885]|uniref:hypothetical protein n=1 Tax=unclassified Citromicrobium TaxID=2630544 RepID=UPI0006C90DDB|nr:MULTISPECIES: hypothetical protein [unclassified Citromicrobium]KPM24701.1 hypothetical protein AAJ72_02855 [Citromicrobium sp. RCC1885]KPM27944.1 hypothetical protein AAJ74_03600 [Citromicrobium sp. RCC1878]MAO02920.1 hypothetical protein [Citromicrobium sp.]OAM10552.1 hypothetical protein A0U43_05810 [Citromicrobium sp. RCC1897]
MRSTIPFNVVVASTVVASFAFLSGCASQPHPTTRECQSSESAARYYFEAITGRSAEQITFEPEEPMLGHSILRVHNPSGKPIGSMLIKTADCSLVIYDTLIVE